MIKFLIALSLALLAFACVTVPGARMYVTDCGARWIVPASTTRAYVQAVEDAVRFDLDVCTVDTQAHYNSDLSCANLDKWNIRVLPLSERQWNADAGRFWFPRPDDAYLPDGGLGLPSIETGSNFQFWGFTDCATGYTTLADDDWRNGTAAVEMIHIITRNCTGYANWAAQGFGCAVSRVEHDFADAGE